MFNTRSLTSSTLFTFFFDLIITSRSTLSYRLIFDLAFLLLSFVFIEIGQRIYRNQRLDEYICRVNGKSILYITIPINILTVYLISSKIDYTYYFDFNNTLLIALMVLPNIAFYILTLICNSIIVKSHINKLIDINIHLNLRNYSQELIVICLFLQKYHFSQEKRNNDIN